MLFLDSNGVDTRARCASAKSMAPMGFSRSRKTHTVWLARDIRGIGLRTADRIAAKLAIEKTSRIRVRAGISFALAEAMDDGHCGRYAAFTDSRFFGHSSDMTTPEAGWASGVRLK